MTELSPEAVKAIETAEKLMRLAGNNTNQHEAAAATAKAMDLLASYNLDISIIEQEGKGAKAARSDEKMAGGLYHYQRDLWHAIATLNFCLYWNQYSYDPDKVSKYFKRTGRGSSRGGFRFQHRVVGRKVNVIATRNMASYLEDTITRLVRAKLGEGQGSNLYSAWAVSYRTGIAEEVISKIYERRRHLMAEETRKRQEKEEAARRAGAGAESNSRGLTIHGLEKSEHDANIDFLYGEGTSAKWEAERIERARVAREAEAAYVAWAKENPEEAKKEEEKRRKERRKYRSSGRSSGPKISSTSAYWEGREDGKNVSIDPQAENQKAGLLK